MSDLTEPTVLTEAYCASEGFRVFACLLFVLLIFQFIQSSQQSDEVVIIFPILQMRQLRFCEVK